MGGAFILHPAPKFLVGGLANCLSIPGKRFLVRAFPHPTLDAPMVVGSLRMVSHFQFRVIL